MLSLIKEKVNFEQKAREYKQLRRIKINYKNIERSIAIYCKFN